MALRTPPSWLQNGSHPAENDRLTTQAIWKTSGIVNATDLQITQNGGGNMSVNVSSGYAAIVGTTQSNMGTYMAYNDASTNLTVSTASGSNPRIDLVVVTVNDAYYTGTLNNVSFQVIAGTPAASPTVPATPANSLALGQIAVGTSVTSILTANITNYGTLATSPFVSPNGTQTLTNKTLVYSVNNQTGTTYTPVLLDGASVITLNNASAISVTIPTNASVAYPVGAQLNFAWITGAGQPTISAVTPGTTTIISTGATSTAPKLRAVNTMATAVKIATDTWLVSGDIV